ncbi:MAG: hypothetical protein KAU94_08560, partial [Verrucomicrobia bacterium]|nr:hypothetical protein [Verrucomicrobiota bacterium]
MTLQFLDTLVPALLHTLWIGLLSAVGLFLALQILPAKRARLRYALGIVALLAIFLGGLVAWEWPEIKSPAPATAEQAIPSFDLSQPTNLSAQPAPVATPISLPPRKEKHDWQKWVGLLWMAGAGISLLRLMRISFGIQQLVRRSCVVESPVAIRLVAELS